MFTRLFVFAISLISIYYGLKAVLANRGIKKWPKAAARFIENGVEYEDKRAIGIGPPAFRYYPRVKYTYYVNDREYTNSSVFPYNIRQYGKKKWAERFLKRILDQTEVFYNPKNPAESCLFLISKTFEIIALLLGIIFLLGVMISLLVPAAR